MLPVTCEVDPNFGKNERIVMVATVTGRDAGTSVLRNLLNAFPGHYMHSYAAGSGWVHLSEFGQRWLLMRNKMTNPTDHDFIHFSQFVSKFDDGFSPSQNTDFRTMQELVRRKIKPAWMQLFNTTTMLCGMRKMIVETYNHHRHASFGFIHAFNDDGANGSTSPLANRAYSAAYAIRSIDLFLELFPLGKVILHSPVADLPTPPSEQPGCFCLGATPHCRSFSYHPTSLQWPDPRTNLMQRLVQYHKDHPDRTIVTAANEDYRNASRMTRRLAEFLGEPETPNLQRVATRAIGEEPGPVSRQNGSQIY